MDGSVDNADVTPDVRQSLLQFVKIVDPSLTHTLLLYDSANLVVNRTELLLGDHGNEETRGPSSG